MKHLFIVNPVAGGEDKTELVSAGVLRCFSGRGGEFEIYTTRAPMDACRKIRMEADRCSELRVYSCGGDGTLNECVCGVYGLQNAAVGCLPIGTGNDFIKLFGREKDRFSSIEELLDGEVKKLDLMLCNGRPCINICSVGIDARIGTDIHKYSSLPFIGGAAGYLTSLAVNFVKGIKDEMRVICGDRLFYGEMSLVCACNGSFYGGGFNPVPEARPDDGELDFLVVKGVSRLSFLRLVARYAKGRYAEYPKYISHIRGKEIDIAGEKEFVINIDGEAMRSKKLSIRLEPGAIPFIVPSQMAFFDLENQKMPVFM